MATGIAGASEVGAATHVYSRAYSVCTLVTRLDEYAEMRENFITGGFSPVDTEYLYVDNSDGNRVDAFSAYNIFLERAASPYLILCHQDVLLLEDGRAKLDTIIEQLNVLDPSWAIIGNAGAKPDGSFCGRISDPHGENQNHGGPFPTRVVSLDENFIVVRRKANLGLSRDLSGFHLYGADLCVNATILGWSAYVVDFHLRHKSGGNKDAGFYNMKVVFRRKYSRAFKSRWLPLPTMSPIYLSGSWLKGLIARSLRKTASSTPLHRLRQ